MRSVQFATMMKPRVFILSDTPHGGSEVRRALEACDCDYIDHVGLAVTADALGSGPTPDVLILMLSASALTKDAPAIEAASAFAASVHCPLLVSAPLPVIDALSPTVWSTAQALLAEPTEVDFAAAIAVAVGGPRHQLHDVARDVDAARLQRLADEVGRIARTLATLSVSAPMPQDNVSDVRPTFMGEQMSLDAEPSAGEVRSVIRMRRLRDRFFDRDLFADPAWDMLLDLMAARIERVQVAVSSLCIAACVPPTTALRWIKTMTDSGLFDRIADPQDGRRIFIRLSDGAAASMTRYFSAMRMANELAV